MNPSFVNLALIIFYLFITNYGMKF